jgi:hypothetical protein
MIDESMETEKTPDREQMRALSFGMVSDLSRLLADKGCGERAIDLVEALAFAMFIIADTYALAKPEKEQAIAVIHGFYDDMRDYFVNQVIIKERQVTDFEEIRAVSDKFFDLSRGRFNEYGAKFKEDIYDPMAMSCPATVNYLLENLFIEPINKEEKIKLLSAVSDKVLHYWAGCVQSFK